MASFTRVENKWFDQDFGDAVGVDPRLLERVGRRLRKILENPKHHGYHAGGRLRCHWVAGVGNWAIIYDVDEQRLEVTPLRFVSLDDL